VILPIDHLPAAGALATRPESSSILYEISMALSEETTRPGADRDLAPETDVLLAGRYRLGPPIGSGSTGVVHRAEDLMFSRQVAVRLVPAALARDDETLARIEGRLHSNAHMLRDDVRALNDLIDVIDLGRADDGRIFVVTDLLPSCESLADVLAREGPLPWRRLRKLAVRACQIIHLSHEHGVVRQDLQTRNLYPVRDKSDAAVLRIYSPGLGVAFGEQLWSCLDADEALQLARYAAPEQISGGQIDRRTDVYALGVILYEALTGQVPFPDPRSSYVLASHLLSRPPPFPPDCRRRGVTPELEAIVMRALAKAPDDRWPDVKALANAMAAIEFGPSEKSGVLEAADVSDLTELLEPAPSATTMRIDRRRLSGKPGLGPLPHAPGDVDPSASTSEMAWREILEAAESAVGAVVSRREPAGVPASSPALSRDDVTAPEDSAPTIPFGDAEHSAPQWPVHAPATAVAVARPRRAVPWVVAAGLALVTAGGVSYALRPPPRPATVMLTPAAPTTPTARRADSPRAAAPVAASVPIATPIADSTPTPASPPATHPADSTPTPASPSVTNPAPADPTPIPANSVAADPTPTSSTTPTAIPTPAPPTPESGAAPAPADAAAGSPPAPTATHDPSEPTEPRASTPKRPEAVPEPVRKPRKRERTAEPIPPPRKAAPGSSLPDRTGHELPDPAAAQPAP
jgi:serine/threonine-protein kinase